VTRWNTVAFDLDDTLYPERDYVLSGFRAVAVWAASRFSEPVERCFCAFKELSASGPRGYIFNRWLDSRGAPTELVPEMVRVYREHEPVIKPFPGISDLLDSLAQKCALGLISDGFLDVQRIKLRALGIEQYFSSVIFTDQLGVDSWKPSVHPFETMLKELESHPGEAVYVGDNPEKDFFGARRLGITTVQCCYSGGYYVELDPPTPEHAPQFTVSSVAELNRLLLNGADDGLSLPGLA
jgi:putative hydrolase of the HAD superfamily